MAEEMSLYDLRVTVERIEGRSVCGLSVGDYFELTESSRLRLPPDRHFCIYALASVIPFLAAKQRRLEDNDWLARDSLIACPSSRHPITRRPPSFQSCSDSEYGVSDGRKAMRPRTIPSGEDS